MWLCSSVRGACFRSVHQRLQCGHAMKGDTHQCLDSCWTAVIILAYCQACAACKLIRTRTHRLQAPPRAVCDKAKQWLACSLSAALAASSYSSNRGDVERQVHRHADYHWHGMPAEQCGMDTSVHVHLTDRDNTVTQFPCYHLQDMFSTWAAYTAAMKADVQPDSPFMSPRSSKVCSGCSRP